MTTHRPGRHTVDTITDPDLQQLYAERDALASDLAELTAARQHGAFTFCPQLVGHVSVAEFARKITEKRLAIRAAQRAEATLAEVRDRLDRAMRALDRAHALAESWQGDQQTITHAQAAEQLMDVIQLSGWTQTDAQPALHVARAAEGSGR